MSLVGHVVALLEAGRYANDVGTTGLTALYVGLAIGTENPADARLLLQQLEREMGRAGDELPEIVETRLRAQSRAILSDLRAELES
jgi:hypothetical protein